MGDDTFRENATIKDGQLVIDSVNRLNDELKKRGKQVIMKFCSKAFELRSLLRSDEHDLAVIIDRIVVGIMKEWRTRNQFIL